MNFYRIRFSLSFALLLLAIQFATGQTPKIRIACIGNSITYGYDLNDPETEAYPAQLQKQLDTLYGDVFDVRKFAVSARTLLKHGDLPFWNEPEFTRALYYAADITIIMLGTNDTKPRNWDKLHNDFISDYQSLLDTLSSQNPEMKFLVCYPPPAFVDVWGIRDSVLVNGVMPAVDTILKHNNRSSLIDFYHTLEHLGNLFPDHIHPNIRGSKDMATIVINRMTETGMLSPAINAKMGNH